MKATNKQKGLIHALAAKCGIYEKDNKHDGLHKFVYQLTLKLSIAELTAEEAERVITHLQENIKAINGDRLPLLKGGARITEAQVKKIFGLTYELQSYDKEPNKASARQRIGGVYKKVLNTAPPKYGDIMKDLSFDDGEKIIEELKRYVRSAKRKAVKHG